MKTLLDKIAQNKQKLTQLLAIPNNKTIMDKWLKTELAYTSNAIEGNTLTRKETALVIEEDITSSPKPINDYLEARNHAKAYDYIIERASEDLPITECTILQIHKLILSGIDDNECRILSGRFAYVSLVRRQFCRILLKFQL